MASMVLLRAAARFRIAPLPLTAAPLSCGRYSTSKEQDVWECLREYGLNPDPSGNAKSASLLLGKLRMLGNIGFTKNQCYKAAAKEKIHFKNVSAETIKENSNLVFELYASDASDPSKASANALKYLVKYPKVLLYGKIHVGVSIMRAAGMIDKTILLFLKRNPRVCFSPTLQDSVATVKKLSSSINPNSIAFSRLLEAFASGNHKTIQLRQLAYEEWGWDETTFQRAAVVNPGILSQAVDTIHRKMQFFRDCGLDSLSLSLGNSPKLLTGKDFEQCLKPRWYVYQFLVNNRLTGTMPPLLNVFKKSEAKFVEFVGKSGGANGQMLIDGYCTWRRIKQSICSWERFERYMAKPGDKDPEIVAAYTDWKKAKEARTRMEEMKKEGRK